MTLWEMICIFWQGIFWVYWFRELLQRLNKTPEITIISFLFGLVSLALNRYPIFAFSQFDQLIIGTFLFWLTEREIHSVWHSLCSWIGYVSTPSSPSEQSQSLMTEEKSQEVLLCIKNLIEEVIIPQFLGFNWFIFPFWYIWVRCLRLFF